MMINMAQHCIASGMNYGEYLDFRMKYPAISRDKLVAPAVYELLTNEHKAKVLK